jgi:DNA-directed RNA polymerase subunit RPC12/RpoP
MKRYIVCATCSKEYPSLFESELGQAMNCSASIFVVDDGRLLMGYYGSVRADGCLYKVLTDELKTGIVCDECISKYQGTDKLELLSDDNYFSVEL